MADMPPRNGDDLTFQHMGRDPDIPSATDLESFKFSAFGTYPPGPPRYHNAVQSMPNLSTGQDDIGRFVKEDTAPWNPFVDPSQQGPQPLSNVFPSYSFSDYRSAEQLSDYHDDSGYQGSRPTLAHQSVKSASVYNLDNDGHDRRISEQLQGFALQEPRAGPASPQMTLRCDICNEFSASSPAILKSVKRIHPFLMLYRARAHHVVRLGSIEIVTLSLMNAIIRDAATRLPCPMTSRDTREQGTGN